MFLHSFLPLAMTHSQLVFTYCGQKHGFSKYVFLDTVHWRKKISMAIKNHVDMESYKKKWVSVTRFQTKISEIGAKLGKLQQKNLKTFVEKTQKYP